VLAAISVLLLAGAAPAQISAVPATFSTTFSTAANSHNRVSPHRAVDLRNPIPATYPCVSTGWKVHCAS
jgi:hypothetical protein